MNLWTKHFNEIMSSNVRTTQVLPFDTPGCSSASADNSSKANSPTFSCIERKYSWIIVVASFWNLFVALGILQILGLYNVEFLEAMEESKSKTAWITSVAGGCVMGLGPLAAMIIDRTSVRHTACLGGMVSTFGILMSLFGSSVVHLSITFGAIMGFGICMLFLSATVIVGQYFQKRRAFATSIASCGGSLGCLLMPLFTTYIIEEYTWRGSLFLLAGVCFQTMVFSSLLRPATTCNNSQKITITTSESEPIHKNKSIIIYTIEMPGTSQHVQSCQGSSTGAGEGDISFCSENRASVTGECDDAKVYSRPIQSSNTERITKLKNMLLENPLSNMGVLLFSLSLMLCNMSVAVISITLSDFIYISLGSKEICAFMLMCIAVGRIGGGIIASLLGNWKPAYCLHMHCASCALVSIVPFLYTCSANAYVFGILSCLFGIAVGVVAAFIAQVTINLVGTKTLAQAIGYEFAAGGLGRLAGPPLAGALFDINGDYMASFWMAAGVMLAAGLLPVITLLRQIGKHQYDVNKLDTQS